MEVSFWKQWVVCASKSLTSRLAYTLFLFLHRPHVQHNNIRSYNIVEASYIDNEELTYNNIIHNFLSIKTWVIWEMLFLWKLILFYPNIFLRQSAFEIIRLSWLTFGYLLDDIITPTNWTFNSNNCSIHRKLK